jgi:hypothetical protein
MMRWRMRQRMRESSINALIVGGCFHYHRGIKNRLLNVLIVDLPRKRSGYVLIIVRLYRRNEGGKRKSVDMIDEHYILGSLADFLTLQFAGHYEFDIKTTIQRIAKDHRSLSVPTKKRS